MLQQQTLPSSDKPKSIYLMDANIGAAMAFAFIMVTSTQIINLLLASIISLALLKHWKKLKLSVIDYLFVAVVTIILFFLIRPTGAYITSEILGINLNHITVYLAISFNLLLASIISLALLKHWKKLKLSVIDYLFVAVVTIIFYHLIGDAIGNIILKILSR